MSSFYIGISGIYFFNLKYYKCSKRKNYEDIYEEMELKETSSSEYAAVVFDYTPEGYLMIEGYWRSQERYVLTLSRNTVCVQ